MGQEHISYIQGYGKDIRIDFLCDPFEQSLETAQRIMKEFQGDPICSNPPPTILTDEEDLLEHVLLNEEGVDNYNIWSSLWGVDVMLP